jgi:Dynamin family
MLLTLLRISDSYSSCMRIRATVSESTDGDDTDTVSNDRSSNPEEGENTRVTDFGLLPESVSSSSSSLSTASASSLSMARKSSASKSKESRKEPVAKIIIMAKSKESRRQKHLSRLEAKKGEALASGLGLNGDIQHVGATTGPNDAAAMDGRAVADLLSNDEDLLLNFVAKVNKVYHEKLHKPAPFMTFVLCGNQSAGKSTIMERFLGSVLNIVQEGTGTRCPLDTTCIHDESCLQPKCNLSGSELQGGGTGISVEQVFKHITDHNRKLAQEDHFSTEPLHLEYRSKLVQNMRFVDTPGIISNKSTGQDNREDIKRILRSELSKPNTKVCILLEPKEYATNNIVDFCDESLGGREGWIGNAIFIMNKFDKQFEDSRSGSKANAFFSLYKENRIVPYLASTPTLAKEDLPPDELMLARAELLTTADEVEKARFTDWQGRLRDFKECHGGDDEDLDPDVSSRLGFLAAKKEMREVMLRDTVERIPEVMDELRRELLERHKESKILKDKLQFSDPVRLQGVVAKMVFQLNLRIQAYLDGDMNSAMKFPEKLRTLTEEIFEEEDSDWTHRVLNHHTDNEDEWRERVADLDPPDDIQPNNKFLGGKQYQRALGLFGAVLVEALPDPFSLREFAPTGAGYLNGGLQREDHEHTMTQITKACLKKITHPGINYLVKHAGYILRRLFSVALDDIKAGEELSSTFKLMPRNVELFLKAEYDKMLWGLMTNAADLTHQVTEAMYSTINPNLPTFHPTKSKPSAMMESELEAANEGMLDAFKKRCTAYLGLSEAKAYLREDSRARATAKKTFLADERTAMVTSDEITDIIHCSFQYIVALMELLLLNYTFQLNHYLFQAFKEKVGATFMDALAKAEWNNLCKVDGDSQRQLEEVEGKIVALTESLEEVQSLQLRA